MRKPDGHDRRNRQGSHEDLQKWLRSTLADAAVAGTPVLRLRLLRTSSKDVEKWLAATRTSFASVDRSDPDVQTALELGFDVVRRDVIGDSARQALGDSVFVLRMHHAPGGKGKRQVGVLLRLGQTLFLYLLTSARAGDLASAEEERAGNAATEFIATAVRGMHAVGKELNDSYRPEVHARDHDRIVRSEYHGSALKSTLIRCAAIVHAPHRLDLLQPAEAQAFSFGTMIGAAAVEAIIRGMNRQEIVLQANGGWYPNMGMAPFTHGPQTYVEHDARTGGTVTTTNEHRLAPIDDVDGARTIMRKLIDRILTNKAGQSPAMPPATDWDAVGKLAAELGLRSRRPTDTKGGKVVPLAQLPASARGRAMKTLFQEKYIEGWRTGSFQQPVRVKTRVDLEIDDLATLDRRKDGTEYYICRIGMPMPDGGWGITDEEWDLVLDRRYPSRRDKKTRKVTGEQLPLGGMVEWDDSEAGQQFRLKTKTGRYTLISRSLTDAYGANGRRGWDTSTKYPRLATLRAESLHRSVGEAMADALIALEARTQPATLSRPAASSNETARADLEAELRRADDELDAAEDQVAGAEDERNAARGRARRGGPAAEVDRAEAALSRANARLHQAQEARAAAQDALDNAETVAADPVELETFVESATAELVAAALIKCTNGAPAWLQQACAWFLDNWTMTVQTKPGERTSVSWACRLYLQLVDSDDGVTVPLSGRVHSTANRRTSAAASTVADWAWRYFYLGEDFPAIGTAAGIAVTYEKNGYLYSQLSDWLRGAIPNASLRTAAIHCPIVETRRAIYFLVTGDQLAIQGLDPGFVTHICDTYRQPQALSSWTWCRDNHELVRSTCAALARSSDGSLPIHELIETLKTPLEPLLKLARQPARATASASSTAMPYLTKNFAHGNAVPAAERRLFLRDCVHADCPARLRGQRSWCTVPLRTPETEPGYAVLCPACLRLPVESMREVYFPAAYLRPWSGRYGARSKNSARNSRIPTFLQPGWPDPGTTQPLADTGCLPGPPLPTRQRKSAYVPAQQRRSTPLGGRAYLLLGLPDAEHQVVQELVTCNGGRLAQRLRSSVAAVVLPDADPADARVNRARELGVPIIRASDFAAHINEPEVGT